MLWEKGDKVDEVRPIARNPVKGIEFVGERRWKTAKGKLQTYFYWRLRIDFAYWQPIVQKTLNETRVFVKPPKGRQMPMLRGKDD